MAPRSELVLEVAAAAVTNLRLDGSLLVRATAPLGRLQAAACLPASVAAPPLPTPQPNYSQTRRALHGLDVPFCEEPCSLWRGLTPSTLFNAIRHQSNTRCFLLQP